MHYRSWTCPRPQHSIIALFCTSPFCCGWKKYEVLCVTKAMLLHFCFFPPSLFFLPLPPCGRHFCQCHFLNLTSPSGEQVRAPSPQPFQLSNQYCSPVSACSGQCCSLDVWKRARSASETARFTFQPGLVVGCMHLRAREGRAEEGTWSEVAYRGGS